MSEVLAAAAVIEQDERSDSVVRDDVLLEEDLLVEDISIDGMCGVY